MSLLIFIEQVRQRKKVKKRQSSLRFLLTFDLMKVVSTPDTLQHFDDLYNKMQIRYGDLKKQLAEDMIIATTPMRERIEAIANDEVYLRQVAIYGAIKARESAQKTIKEVREIIGFRKF